MLLLVGGSPRFRSSIVVPFQSSVVCLLSHPWSQWTTILGQPHSHWCRSRSSFSSSFRSAVRRSHQERSNPTADSILDLVSVLAWARWHSHWRRVTDTTRTTEQQQQTQNKTGESHKNSSFWETQRSVCVEKARIATSRASLLSALPQILKCITPGVMHLRKAVEKQFY